MQCSRGLFHVVPGIQPELQSPKQVVQEQGVNKGSNLFAVLSATLSWALEKSKLKVVLIHHLNRHSKFNFAVFIFPESEFDSTSGDRHKKNSVLYDSLKKHWGKIYDSRSGLAVLRVKHKNKPYNEYFSKISVSMSCVGLLRNVSALWQNQSKREVCVFFFHRRRSLASLVYFK